MLVQDLLTASLRTILALDPGDTPSSSELNDAQTIANNYLDGLSAETLPVFNLTRETFPLNGSAFYTIGPSGGMATVKPIKIEAANVVLANGASHSIRVVPVEEWNSVPDKTATGLFAEVLYYDDNFPNATFYMHPKPTGGTIELYSYKPLAQFVNLTDPLNLAPGYLRLLRYGIAKEAALEWNRAWTDVSESILADAKATVLGLNQAILGRPNTVEPPAPTPTTPNVP